MIPVESLVERALKAIVPFRDISDHTAPTALYLRRFFLSPKIGRGWQLYLHKICRPDHARDFHNHPWDFVTLCLSGGYTEFIRTPSATVGEDLRPGTIRMRSNEHVHRIAFLKDDRPCWTLVLTGPKQKTWGFFLEDRWWTFIPWRTYCKVPDDAHPDREHVGGVRESIVRGLNAVGAFVDRVWGFAVKASQTLRRAAAALREAARDGSARFAPLAAEVDELTGRLECVAGEVKYNRFADAPTPTARELLTTIGEQP